MKNKKVISLLLALAMVMSFVCPAFAAIEVTVNAEKDEYYFGETVKVSGTSEQDEMYCVSTKVEDANNAKNIIIIDSFDAVNGKYSFEIKLPDEASTMWPAGEYKIEVAGKSDTFKIVESDDVYKIKVKATNCDVEVDPEVAKEGEEITISIDPKKNYYVKTVTVRGDKSNKKITTKGGRNDEYTFEMPAENVTVTVTCAKEGSTVGGGGSSSGGSTGGIIISGVTGLTGSTGGINAVLNENQYSKYGVEPGAVAVKGTYSNNTFTVTVAINGTKYTTFEGYNPVMVKVPYTSTSMNPTNLVVMDQYGNVVPRSLYKNGYMYVAMNDINGVFTITEVNKTFTDTNIDWANQAISALAARDIINGMGDGTFAPNETVTRAQFVKMIISMLDVHNPNATATFADVAGNEWYASYVATANDLGITLGYAEDNTFRPNNIITREEMSAMLYRAADVMTVKLNAVKDATVFADDAYIQDYAKTAVYNMQKAGVLQGVGNNMFDPKGSCTRAQAAVAIFNMFQVTMDF